MENSAGYELKERPNRKLQHTAYNNAYM